MPRADSPRPSATALIATASAGFAVAALLAQPQTDSIAGVRFERDVTPFAVFDADETPYPLPFLGGLDVPRPQFVDIDHDGDHDLFLQEYPDALWFFENTGTAVSPHYVWRSDRFQNVEIGDWFRFADIDGDGLMDLIGERRFSYIRHYRNVGTPSEPRLELVGDLLDAQGAPLFLDRQNVPALVDLDCDDRLDLFVGRVEGVVDRYEAESPGSARFAFIAERFEGIEIIGQIGGLTDRPTRHGANALALADFEGDGDVDLFWGDFFEPSVLLIENIGRTCSTPSFAVDPIVLPYADGTATSGYNAPAPVDVDFDGDLDFFMGVIGGAFNPVGTAEDNFFFWERTADDRLELRSRRFLNGIDVGNDAAPAVGDVDADGDLDILLGNKTDPRTADAARFYQFTNIGTATAPSLTQGAPVHLADAFHLAPALGDLDADGDLDMLLGTWNQDVWYFRNDGTATTPHWVRDESATIAPPRLSQAIPALGDLDGDGDLDLVIGQATGRFVLYRNAGTAEVPAFEFVSDRLDDLRVGRRSAPALVDVDGDGRLDLVSGSESGEISVYRNAGSGSEIRFEEVAGLTIDLDVPAAPASVPRFADLTGDGVPDLIVGTTGGGLRFYRGVR